jgi:hypothetical protein
MAGLAEPLPRLGSSTPTFKMNDDTEHEGLEVVH